MLASGSAFRRFGHRYQMTTQMDPFLVLQHARFGGCLLKQARCHVCRALDCGWVNTVRELVLDGDYAHAELFAQFRIGLAQSAVDVVSQVVRVATDKQIAHLGAASPASAVALNCVIPSAALLRRSAVT